MITEAINRLVEIVSDGEGFDEVPIYRRGGKVLFSAGKVIELAESVPARKHTACDLDALVAYAQENSVIWHNCNAVTLVVDDQSESRRDDFVVWLLAPSEKLAAMEAAVRPRTHGEFINFLVTNLREELDAAVPGLLGVLRNLKFKTLDESEGKIAHGRESMGRAIEREVTGTSELPESLRIKVRRWTVLDYFCELEVMLKLDVNERKLALVPLADELARAELAAQQWLNQELTEAAPCPVLHGSA